MKIKRENFLDKGNGFISSQITQISIRGFVLVAKNIKTWADKGFNEGKH